jgi:hypothetical protein
MLESRLADRAPLHVVSDGLLLALIKLIIQQTAQLVQGHTGFHWLILWCLARAAG